MPPFRFRFALATATALFGFLSPSPLFAAEEEIKATPVWTETFDNDSRGWIGTPSPDWKAAIGGGVLSGENRHARDLQASLVDVVVSMRRKPELTLDVRFRPGKPEGGAGLQWGASADRTGHLYFIVSPQGRFWIGRSNATVRIDAKTGATGKLLRTDGFNRLAVRVLGERTAYFLNGAVLWVGPTEPPPGTFIGPTAEPGVSAEFDNLQIGYLRVEDPVSVARLAAYEAAVGDPTKVFLDAPSVATAANGGTFDIARSEKTVSPATLAGWWQQGFDLAQKYQYVEAEKLFRQVLSHAPEDTAAHVQLAWSLLNRNVIPEAKRHADFAVLINPTDLAANLLASYAAAAMDDWAAAQRWMNTAFFLDSAAIALPYVQKDLEDLVRNGRGPAFADRLKGMLAERYARRSLAFVATGKALAAAGEAHGKRDFATAEEHARTAAAASLTLPQEWRIFSAYTHQVLGTWLFNSDDSRRARPFLEEAYASLQRAGASASGYVRAHNAALLAGLALGASETARARDILNASLDAALALPAAANRLKADLLQQACGAANELNQTQELRTHAQRMLGLRGTGQDTFFQALGENFVGASYIMSTLPPDRQRARAAFERALKLAQDGGYDELASSVTANLSLSYWQAGERDRAKNIYLELATRAEQQGHFLRAETALNNLAAMQFTAMDYAAAAVTFQRAVALTESARASLSGEQRIHFLASRLSAYQFLVVCLQHTNDSAGLFEAMNNFRARSLAETLHLGASPAAVTLAQFQQSLAADEAAIFYALMGGGEIVAQVVTRTGAAAVHHSDYPAFVELKKKYLDQLNAGRTGYKPVAPVVGADNLTYVERNAANQISRADFDDLVELTRGLIDSSTKATPELRAKVVPEFLGAFQRLLIAPLESHLAGRKKLILFPDGILNFVPFEALPDARGRNLVEQFDVRYCQSAAVWQLLHGRRYPTEGRESFFGMGGAVYHAMQETAPRVENQTRMVELQLRAQQNVAANRPQREVYAAIFGNEPMKYLKGSLTEVQQLAKIFPKAVVFTGAEMTENRIKAMVQDGSLRRFKIIHLATHGFALPEVPELSGLAMSIFPLAQGGEDGYLTAPEIARLGLQADIAVLSACETGLGRIYGGEGVAGLTGALLVGGANRALVSLWPVSDDGTMHFMRELYALTHHEGKSYDDAVNIVKRRFIQGKFGDAFRDLHIWAAFIHYGL